MRANLHTKYNIGDKVTIYKNYLTKDGRLTRSLTVEYGVIKEIIIKKDVFGDYFYSYRLDNDKVAFEESITLYREV